MNTIQKIRKELNLSQQKFAVEVGVSQSTICQAETGRIILRPSVAQRIIDFCSLHNKKITLDDLYSTSENKTSG